MLLESYIMQDQSVESIRVEGLIKSFYVRGVSTTVLDNINLSLPKNKTTAVLGKNGAGKSTFLRIIAGAMVPSFGRVITFGSVSWPIGFAGNFHRELTGAQNVLFVARIYGIDTQSLIDFVEDFAELGDYFYMPVRSYSSGMMARLAFGLAMGVSFDVYLIDEVTAVGDARFREKSAAIFAQRIKSASALLVSHNMQDVQNLCDSALILDQGKLQYTEDVAYAIDTHRRLMKWV